MQATSSTPPAAVVGADTGASGLSTASPGETPATDAFAALLESLSGPATTLPLPAAGTNPAQVEPASTQEDLEPDTSWLAALPESALPQVAAPLLALAQGSPQAGPQAAAPAPATAGTETAGPAELALDAASAAAAAIAAAPGDTPAVNGNQAALAPAAASAVALVSSPGFPAPDATATVRLAPARSAAAAPALPASPRGAAASGKAFPTEGIGQEVEPVAATPIPQPTAPAVEVSVTPAGAAAPLSAPAGTPQHAGVLQVAGFTAPSTAPANAGPVHQAGLPSQPLDAAFAGDLATEVRLMVASGFQRAELRLNPVDLGPIHIQLSVNSQTADISFAASHGATRDGITQALPALREMLAGQGLSLGQAGVSSQHPGQPSDDGRQLPVYASHRLAGADSSAATSQLTAPLAGPVGRGMLDLFA